jgi:hypothetical protein
MASRATRDARTAPLEPPSLESSSSPLLNGSSFSDTGRLMRLVPLLLAILPF